MKRNILVIVCLLLVTAMIVTVFAAGNGFSLSASTNTLQHGDTITLSASVSCSDPATSYGLMLSYDEAVFELVSGECTVEDALVSSFNNGFAFMFQDAAAYSGEIGTVTFKVKDTAAFGSTVVSGNASVKNGSIVVPTDGVSISLEIVCNHSLGAWTNVNETTHKRVCSICQKEETAEHSWNNGEITKQPTESEEGVRLFTCQVCGGTKEEQIPCLEHVHQYSETETAPTCTNEGYTTYTCACGDSYVDHRKAALGHDERIIAGTAATCTEAGLSEGKHCDRCNVVLKAQETIPALGHSWDTGVVTKGPTEDANGIRTYTCIVCGDLKTEEIPPLNHEHLYHVVISDPTCTQKGYTTYTCSCGDTYTDEEVAALGHKEVTVQGYEATCTEEGLSNGVHCDRCGEVLTKQETIPVIGHDFTDGTCHSCGMNALVITTQPKTAYAKMGQSVKVTLAAEGEELQYQWYIRNANKEKYSKSSVTGPVYSCKMSEKSKNRRALCIITDKYGNEVQSKTIVIREAVSIVTEPKTTYARLGETLQVKFEASGDGLTYQWYLKNAGGEKYSKSSIKSDTYTVEMSKKVDGRRIRCVVKDKYGNKVETKTVILRMAATITEQPQSVTVEKGTTARATVKAVGTDLTYQWYVKNEGASKFSKSSITKATYSVKMSEKADGRQVYCVITDKYGKTVKSDTVVLTMK